MKVAAAVIFAWLFALPAYAGSRAASGESTHPPEVLSRFAKQVEQFAAAKGARVFYLARIGAPPKSMPKGVEFTHVGLAVYSNIALEDGETIRGYAIHNLYQDENKDNRSYLQTDFPVDFFAPASELKAGILIPSLALQKQLHRVLEEDRHLPLHNPNYSILSNPFDLRYQNCTEYLLDLTFAAIYGIDDRALLKAHQEAYFTPQRIRLSPLKSLLGRLGNKIKSSEHRSRLQTTTFGALHRFLQQAGAVETIDVLRPISVTAP